MNTKTRRAPSITNSTRISRYFSIKCRTTPSRVSPRFPIYRTVTTSTRSTRGPVSRSRCSPRKRRLARYLSTPLVRFNRLPIHSRFKHQSRILRRTRSARLQALRAASTEVQDTTIIRIRTNNLSPWTHLATPTTLSLCVVAPSQ